MILADKIINLRKKNGWSQEEFAEKLGVSRQSVSKYESAQSIPDLDKIIKMSRIFGVTTDYLIKDEMEDEEFVEMDVNPENTRYKVTMEMANDFLQIKKESAVKIAFATFLCIISPICLIILAGISEDGRFGISEDMAAGIGLIILFILIAIAVSIFIFTYSKARKYDFFETEEIETEYGVDGMVKEKKEKFHDAYLRNNIIGTVCCIGSVIPIFVGVALKFNDFLMVIMVGVLITMVATGVFFFVTGGTYMSAMNKILEEDDYSRKQKKLNKSIGGIAGAYWMVATALYLGYSFITNDWDRSWIVWPVAGVLYPVFHTIISTVKNKNQ